MENYYILEMRKNDDDMNIIAGPLTLDEAHVGMKEIFIDWAVEYHETKDEEEANKLYEDCLNSDTNGTSEIYVSEKYMTLVNKKYQIVQYGRGCSAKHIKRLDNTTHFSEEDKRSVTYMFNDTVISLKEIADLLAFGDIDHDSRVVKMTPEQADNLRGKAEAEPC